MVATAWRADLKVEMPPNTTSKVPALPAALHELSGATQEAEVYGALGALLGTLEVIAMDDGALTSAQSKRLRTAIGFAQQLQQYVEALLTLSAEDLEPRLRRAQCAVRPLVEHAVRGSLRGLEGGHALTLRWPEHVGWGEERVCIDVSRVDRALGALVAALASSLGPAGALEVAIRCEDGCAILTIRGEHDADDATCSSRFECGLLERALRRLLELQNGALALDASQPSFELKLPLVEVP